MKKLFREFREFITRGNVLDMAVGVIIATAFGKITTSLINDILMPFIGWLIGDVDFTAMKVVLVKGTGEVLEDGTIAGEVAIRYGALISAIINFLLVALVVFLIVKAFNAAHHRMEALRKKQAEEAPAPAEPSKEEALLTQIRDLLQEQNARP
jgi:large conductance mechanosensitive channel